jgi:hypothetical protein
MPIRGNPSRRYASPPRRVEFAVTIRNSPSQKLRNKRSIRATLLVFNCQYRERE